MPNCPKCDVVVDHLVNRVAEVHYYDLRVEGDSPEYEEQDWEPIGQGDYRCPECQEHLFKTEAEALAFLKG
ncbi:MAG: hypothetical protein V3U26_05050 [Dehalococcoidia bacterium]